MTTFPAAAQSQSKPGVAERDDGTVQLTTAGRQFVLSRALADAVSAASRDHLDDPPALRDAVAAILGDCDEDPDVAPAIVAFTVYHVRGRSAAVDATLRAAFERCANLSADDLLSILPEASLRTRDADADRLARLQATLENPSQISPVE